MPKLLWVGLILFGVSGAFSLWAKRYIQGGRGLTQKPIIYMLLGFAVATVGFVVVTYQVIVTYPWDW